MHISKKNGRIWHYHPKSGMTIYSLDSGGWNRDLKTLGNAAGLYSCLDGWDFTRIHLREAKAFLAEVL